MEKTKRRCMLFLILVTLFCGMLPLRSFAAIEDGTAEQEMQNILQNGGFEIIGTDGKATGWNPSTGSFGEEVSLENYPYLVLKADQKGVFAQQKITGDHLEGNYQISAELKRINGKALISVIYGINNEEKELVSISDTSGEAGEWTEKSSEKFTVPEGTSYVLVMVRLLPSSTGEIYWKNIKLMKENEQGQFENILKNGDLGEQDKDQKPRYWTIIGEWGTEVYLEKIQSEDVNEKYLKLKAEKSVFVQQSVLCNNSQKNYSISAKLKKCSGKPVIKVEYYDASNAFISDQTFDFSNAITGIWENVGGDLQVPSNTGKISILVRLLDAGEVFWDDIQLSTEVDDTALIAKEFRDMLEREALESQKIGKKYDGNPYEERVPFQGQASNLLENSGFEEGLNGWKPFNEIHEGYSLLAEGSGHDSENALEFSATAEQEAVNPIRYQIVENVAGGAEYQVCFWYKIEEGDKVEPLIKLETYGETINGILTGYSHANIQPENGYERDGRWHYVVKRVRISDNAKVIHVMARALTPAKENMKILIDDIGICMTDAPSVMALDTESIFFYEGTEKASFRVKVDTVFHPELKSAKVDFEVYQGKTSVAEKRGLICNEGEAGMEFSLSGLEKEIPYCVKAILYKEDGEIADVKTQNIYIYSRPEYLKENGIYQKDGVNISPVMAYHVLPEQYAEVASAGINVVQMEPFASPEEALKYLDAAQAAGIMGFIPLYNNMEPAGADSNIDRTVRLLSDKRVVEHLALFGYGIMDEVFVNLSDPYEDMEASFRLVRKLDPKHPIMTVEAFETYYGECSKFVDILVIDPYNTAESQMAYTSTKRAIEAVKNMKPVYTLLETYRTANGRLLSAEDVRNNNYQALLAGADGIGYFSIRDAERDDDGKWTIPIWNAKDGGQMWNALKLWGTKEKEAAYDHFLYHKSETINEKLEGDYWYHSWKEGNCIYVLVMGMKNGQEIDVAVPLPTEEMLKNYSIETVGGNEESKVEDSSLKLKVHGVETSLYKINVAGE